MRKHVLPYARPELRPRPLTALGVLLLVINVLAIGGGMALALTSLRGGAAAIAAGALGLVFMLAASVLFAISLVYLDEHEDRVKPGLLTATVWTSAVSVALSIVNLLLAVAFR